MPLNYKQLLKIILSFGYEQTSQRGSHVKFRRGSHTIVLPKHKEIKKGTASSIIKDIALQNNTSEDSIKGDRNIKL